MIFNILYGLALLHKCKNIIALDLNNSNYCKCKKNPSDLYWDEEILYLLPVVSRLFFMVLCCPPVTVDK